MPLVDISRTACKIATAGSQGNILLTGVTVETFRCAPVAPLDSPRW